MATDRIDELKSVQFPTERRGGYDRRAVDAYLAELADWLETGGGDEARRSTIQRELGRVGERTGGILSTAQESADNLTAEAEAAASALRADAEREAAETRASADEYAAKTRSDADEYSTTTRADADARAKEKAEAAAIAAVEIKEEADERLRRAEEEAAARTRGIEQEIADLVRKRRDVVANLEQLNAEMKLAIDGPGEKDLGLPDRVSAAVEDPGLLAEDEIDPGEAPTQVSRSTEVVTEVDEGEDEDSAAEAEAEAAERERRRRSVDSVDPPTDDQKLTELL